MKVFENMDICYKILDFLCLDEVKRQLNGLFLPEQFQIVSKLLNNFRSTCLRILCKFIEQFNNKKGAKKYKSMGKF